MNAGLIGLIRASWRLPGVVLVLVFYFTRLLFGLLLDRGRPASARKRKARHFQIITQRLLWIMGGQVRVAGPPPSPRFFLVSNHMSYLDVLLLGSQLSAVFIAKSEVAKWPVLGFLCTVMDTLYINRSSRRDLARVNDLIQSSMTPERGVILFGEGTSSAGPGVLPLRPSLLEPAAQADLPVSFCRLQYETLEGDPPAEEVLCWWGDMGFSAHFWKLLQLRGFRASVRFGEKTIQDSDRKRLAQRLHRSLSDLVDPVAGWEDSAC